jgi:predicted amidohydrolase
MAKNPTVHRVAAVQWNSKHYENSKAVIDEIAGIIRAASNYKADFVLFPEFFTLCLAADSHASNDIEGMRELARHSEYIIPLFEKCAKQYNINVIGGTLPVIENDKIYNICYYFGRDGLKYQYAKTHLTLFERACRMTAGDKIEAWDTDCGKIGVLICYDCEFPEAARKLALQGAKILFVPFQTDALTGYHRVRRCAQARAIENECYVVITGSAGDMPQLSLLEFQYAQAAVFTPSDYFFPSSNVLTEASPNTPTTIVCDLDMALLERLHSEGSVRTLTHRRPELY